MHAPGPGVICLSLSNVFFSAFILGANQIARTGCHAEMDTDVADCSWNLLPVGRTVTYAWRPPVYNVDREQDQEPPPKAMAYSDRLGQSHCPSLDDGSAWCLAC